MRLFDFCTILYLLRDEEEGEERERERESVFYGLTRHFSLLESKIFITHLLIIFQIQVLALDIRIRIQMSNTINFQYKNGVGIHKSICVCFR